jgi:3-hydroxybutyryl-CoA dehydratase
VTVDVRPVVREISQSRIDAYADASGDHNPVHVDPAFASATPFGGTIAHGMLVLALMGEMMHDAYGDAWNSSGRLKVRFKSPTRSGDTVTASALSSRDTADGIEYTVQCANQDGEVLVEGRASVAVRR